MSNTLRINNLTKILAYTDEELVSNWSRLGSLVKNHRNIEWRDAQKVASQLLKDDEAKAYVEQVRAEFNRPKEEPNPPKAKKEKPKKKAAKVVPINTSRDRYSMNYRRLLKIAPELAQRLEHGGVVAGKSAVTGYMDFRLELVHSDKTGYYLAISHTYIQNGDIVPDPDMQILVNTENETVEALAFQNALYYREVYGDIYNRKLVRLSEKKSQNEFLEKWFKNLIEQGHVIEWDEPDHDDDKGEIETEIESLKESETNPKLDLSTFTEMPIEPFREKFKSAVLDDVIQLYLAHKKGEKSLTPLALYLIVERINESPIGMNLPYPTEAELKAFFDKRNALELNEIEWELDNEENQGYQPSFDEKIFTQNHAQFEELAPTFINAVEAKGIPIAGKTIVNKGKSILNVTVDRELAGGYELTFLESKESDKETDFMPLMKIYLDPVKKQLRALSVHAKNGEVETVYEDVENLKNMDTTKLWKLNNALGDWLKTLLNNRHEITHWTRIELEVENEPQEESTEEKPTVPELTVEEAEATAKYWTKLAAFIEQTEGLDKETAKTKALKLKEEGKAENYIAERYARQAKMGQNQLLKTNYQKLLRLIPELFNEQEKVPTFLVSKTNFTPVSVENLGTKDKFVTQIALREFSTPKKTWIIHVQKTVKKVIVANFMGYEDAQKKDNKPNGNVLFSHWLDRTINDGYKRPPQAQDFLDKYPIVIEWAESSEDENVGLKSLEALQKRMQGYRVVEAANRGYTKVKVWFRNYPNYVRIDLSNGQGDYNPHKQDLLVWLKDYDPDFNWSQFSKPVKKSVKELQLEADDIPNFEVGKVKLTARHIKAGITQKHIDWINKHGQGMTVIPLKRMTNKTKDFTSDLEHQAKKPGFRISRTGKLYYETRSNRSDLTDAGL